MNFNAGEIYTFKLTSGEELIAKVESVHNTHLMLGEPVSIAPGPKGIGLVPSMFTADASSGVRLNTSMITLCAHTEDSVRMKYIEATTGLQVPDKKLILG